MMMMSHSGQLNTYGCLVLIDWNQNEQVNEGLPFGSLRHRYQTWVSGEME